MQHNRQRTAVRQGFTLMELLIVMMIISLLAGLSVAALSGTAEIARENRTRAIITKCDQLIMERWEEYRTRRVPLRTPPNTNARLAARARLDMIRELMRLELPCCQNDVLENPVILPNTAIPACTMRYRRLVNGTSWTSNEANVEAECLYLIISSMRDGDKNAIDFFGPEEIADRDEDGVPEILDAWGNPLVFWRWAPGFTELPGPDGGWGVVGVDDNSDGTVDNVAEAGWPLSDDYKPATLQTRIAANAPDPFDPLKVDPRVDSVPFPTPTDTHGLPFQHKPPFNFTSGYPLNFSAEDDTFALKPLIISMGRDKQLGMNVPDWLTPGVNYALTTPPNDPYVVFPTVGGLIGTVVDPGTAADNITNHYVDTQ